MPSITGGLNGAPAGRFLDVSGGVGVLFPDSTINRIQGCREGLGQAQAEVVMTTDAGPDK